MTDRFASYSVTPNDPMIGVEVVTPNDEADLENVSRGLLISVPSTVSFPVRVTLLNGDAVTLFLSAGTIHQLRVKRVHATGTDPQLLANPGSIVGFW